MLTPNKFNRIGKWVLTILGYTPAPSSGVVTIDAVITKSGNTYSGIARRTMNIATAETRQINFAPSTAYAPAAMASEVPTSVSVSFAAGSATAPFTVTSATAQPE